MDTPRDAQKQRKTRVAREAVIVLAALIALGGVGVLVMRNQTTPTTVSAAVENFRADAEKPAKPNAQPVAASPVPDDGAGPENAARPGSAGQPAPEAPARTSAPPPTANPEPDNQRAPAPDEAPAEQQEAPVAERSADRALSEPSPGVYVYETDGFEKVNTAGGSRHDYPAETTITVRDTDCGFTTRWQPLDERYDETVICATPERHVLDVFTTYHEFFNQGDTHAFQCDDAAVIATPEARAGARSTWACVEDGTTLTNSVHVVEIAQRQVDGTSVEAIHVRIDSRLEGHIEGTRTADVWYDRWTGLEIEGTYASDMDVPTPVGSSHYTERVTRRLTHLEPHR